MPSTPHAASGRRSPRMANYLGLATAAACTSPGLAAVVIVDLQSPVSPTYTDMLNLGTAVASETASHFKMFFTGGFNGGSGADNGSAFLIGGGFLGYSQSVDDSPAAGTWYRGGNIGVLADGATGYFGFRLQTQVDGELIYGWIEATNNGGTLVVGRWAYESTSNTAIQTPLAPSAVPGAAGLAALAVGAAGVRGRRRSGV